LQTDVQNELDTVEKWQHILQTVNVKFVWMVWKYSKM